MVGTMTNIHKRKLAEVALSESEQRYRLLFDSAEELISVFDRHGVCHLMNRRAAEFFQCEAEELVEKSFSELHLADGEEYTRRVREVIDTGMSQRYEDEVGFPAGKRWLHSRVYPIASADGDIDTALIISRDITERRAIEQALLENEEKLKTLINAATEDVVVLLNADLEMEIVNERAALGFGRPVEQLIGHPLGEFMPPEIAASRRDYARRVMESGRSARFEDQRAGRWYDNNMCPVFDSRGKVQAVAVFARDITERRAMEEKLAQAKEAAEAASIAKSRFLAAANHDLRQPLQALRLLMEALSLHPLESSASELLLDMSGALKSMEGLLNALLDSSKLEAGSFQPRKRKFHIVPFLHHLRNQFKATAQDAQKRIRVVPSDAVLFTDPALLGRILQNFVSNALRHARGPDILIGCRRSGQGRRIEVWDDGPGIPQGEQQKIFDEFYQLGNPARNAEQGLGLGLSIAKRMADLLNCRIGVRSAIGKGSVFFVEVPFSEASDEVLQPVSSVRLKGNGGGNSILVVDDDRLVLSATEKLLRTIGFEVISAATAEEAIRLAKERGKGLRLALLDYRLPNGWDGIRLAHRLGSELNRQLPVILITGDTAVTRLREVKLSELPVLHKPINIGELRGLIEKVAPRNVADH